MTRFERGVWLAVGVLIAAMLFVCLGEAQDDDPGLVYEHTFVNGGGACTQTVEGVNIRLVCANIPTDIRSKVTFSFIIDPNGGVTDGDLTETEHDGHTNSAHNMFGLTNLPAHLKIGEYILTASFNGDGFFGDTDQRLHVGRNGGKLQIFLLNGTTTIDNQ
jgi:hypothetical protein